MKKLINSETKQEIKAGDTVTTSRGERGVLETLRPDEGMAGKVYVKVEGRTYTNTFYPSVIGCEFVDA